MKKNIFLLLVFLFLRMSVESKENVSCGIYCIKNILAKNKISVSYKNITSKCNIYINQVLSFEDIRRCFNQYDFYVMGYKLDINELDAINKPIILHTKYNHFILLNKITKNRYYLSDYDNPHLVLSNNEFKKIWDGNILEVTKNKSNILYPVNNDKNIKIDKKIMILGNWMSMKSRYVILSYVISPIVLSK